MAIDSTSGLFQEERDALHALIDRLDAGDTKGHVLWEWDRSRVWRTHPLGRDGPSFVCKRAREPLTDEPRILAHVSEAGQVPVPTIYVVRPAPDDVTMVMEDLGPSVRDATADDAARLAVGVHASPVPTGLRFLDETGLANLLTTARSGVDHLVGTGRWQRGDALLVALEVLEKDAARLATGASMPPFGLCHSEYHPTSLHIGQHRTAVVDWARAYHGPGLLDLASFPGTQRSPDVSAVASLIDRYVEADGPQTAASRRGDLDAATWALVWHRIWVAEWYIDSCVTWVTDPEADGPYETVTLQHLQEAIALIDLGRASV